MEPTTTTPSPKAFHAKSAADKCLSYMWYIHVLTAVNTEARLRANLAPHLVSADTALTDHLVLRRFADTLLARLAATPPILAVAADDGYYARLLADIAPPDPAGRAAFAHRLYTLLFARGIVEWPRGIDVPEPAIIPAAEPARHDGCVDAWRRAAAAAARDVGPPASGWMRSPSRSSGEGGGGSGMERGVDLGTVAKPLPPNYFSQWDWGDETNAVPDGIDGHSVSSQQSVLPFTRRKEQSETPTKVLKVSRQ